MGTQLYYSPFIPAFSNIGIPVAQARLYFYYSQTTTLAPIYSDAARTVPLTNPVLANLAGKFPDIYLDDSITYRVVQTDVLGVPIGDAIDPYIPGRALKGDPGGNVLSIGTFSIANTLSIPIGTDLVQTAGYSSAGFGSAKYTYDSTINSAYVTANPRTSFMSANGRGFKLAEPFVNVQQTGAKGDGTTDDTFAIQAALDYMGLTGGGTVYLARNSDYRVTDTIRIPGFVSLMGASPIRYPFAGTRGTRIVADFPSGSLMKWIVEANTRKSSTGNPVYAYNERVSGDLASCIPAYNVGVFNLTITAINTIPYGGLRIHGAPGASVDGVGISNVGTGFFLNFSFDCHINIHTMGLYCGAALWDDVNACSLKIYCAQDYSKPKTVPTAYRLPFMVSLDGTLVAASAMATDSHTTRSFGLVMGSTTSLCVNNDLRFTSERYSGGMFLKGVQGLEITRFYCEGSPGDMDYAIAATNANNVHLRAVHAYMQGGTLVDLGAAVAMSMTPGGIVNPSTFGTGPWQGDTSQLVVNEVRPTPAGAFQPAVPRSNIHYPDLPGPWIQVTTGFSNGWGPTAAGFYYRLNRGRTEYRGALTGGTYGTAAVTIPSGFRPPYGVGLGGPGDGTAGIGTNGVITLYPNGATVGFDGLWHEAGG